MTKQSRIAMLVSVALALCWPASAEESQPPRPAKEMAQLKAYEGAFACQGSVPEGPLGPARKTHSKVKFQKDLDGMWLTGGLEEPASQENPQAYRGTAHMAFDGAAKSFVLLWLDNYGGWAKQLSPGWEGDKMVWVGEGSMMGKTLTARDTFTKKGADLQHLGELQMDGKWVIVQDELCRPQAGKK